jgi:hypothetical protein
MSGFTWTCPCGAWGRFPAPGERDADLIKHSRKCSRVPSGHEVRNVRTGELLWRKR